MAGFRHLSDDRRADLEKHEFMMGEARGRLAITMDVLTDALILIGQHGVYCRGTRDPAAPPLDLQAVLRDINGAKELVSSVMEKLREERGLRIADTARAANNAHSDAEADAPSR